PLKRHRQGSRHGGHSGLDRQAPSRRCEAGLGGSSVRDGRRTRMLETRIDPLDEGLSAHDPALGADFEGYRNHAYRVANFCFALTSDSIAAVADPDQVAKIALAAAFHDLGIWTDGTFDYLLPSNRLASAYLAEAGRSEWAPEISETILQHHK